MASTEQGRRPRRSFTEQYKAEVVALCRGSEKPISEIARDLDLAESSVLKIVAAGKGTLIEGTFDADAVEGNDVEDVGEARRQAHELEHISDFGQAKAIDVVQHHQDWLAVVDKRLPQSLSGIPHAFPSTLEQLADELERDATVLDPRANEGQPAEP